VSRSLEDRDRPPLSAALVLRVCCASPNMVSIRTFMELFFPMMMPMPMMKSSQKKTCDADHRKRRTITIFQRSGHTSKFPKKSGNQFVPRYKMAYKKQSKSTVSACPQLVGKTCTPFDWPSGTDQQGVFGSYGRPPTCWTSPWKFRARGMGRQVNTKRFGLSSAIPHKRFA
jgi:hypothetical protein